MKVPTAPSTGQLDVELPRSRTPTNSRAVDPDPPGPLAAVRITPSRLHVEFGGSRRSVRDRSTARAGPWRSQCDTRGACRRPWAGSSSPREPRRKRSSSQGRAPAHGTLSVLARSKGREASAEISVEVAKKLAAGHSQEGIPEPELVDQPGARWRSRIAEGAGR